MFYRRPESDYRSTILTATEDIYHTSLRDTFCIDLHLN